MKKLLFGLLSLFLATGTLVAQDGKKAMRKASSALVSYNADKKNNAAKLDEAIEQIEMATQDAEISGTAKVWQVRGEVYNSQAEQDFTQMLINAEHQPDPKNLEAAYKAQESFTKALEKAEKKFETREALSGLENTASYINSYANYYITGGEYAAAYTPLQRVVDIHETLVAEGKAVPFLQEEADLNNHYYVTAVTGNAAGETDAAKAMLKKLIDKDYDQPAVYSTYAQIMMKEDEAAALQVIEKARAKYPDNSDILFAEINYYITKGDNSALESKLTEAIEKEPDNVTLYAALGNVYTQLFTEATGNGNEAAAQGYYDKAMQYFNTAIEKDPKAYQPIYSIGSLYFNKAVELQKMQNNLGMSRADQAKYDELNKEINGLFDQALPFFLQADELNKEDRNTLIALKEIYARKDDLTKSGEYKARLEALNK